MSSPGNTTSIVGSTWVPGTVAATAALSALGSLPQHLMALVVAPAIGDGLASVEQASWISASFVLGMLAGSIGLPAAGVSRIPRWAAAGLLAAMAGAGQAALPAGRQLGGLDWMMCCFIGAACGGLNVLGSL